MALLQITSPHLRGKNRTASVMQWVLLATLPGFVALTWFFGWGVLINVVWASLLALVSEAAIVKLRKRPVMFYLGDYSAVVTAVLLGLALPPFAPWWVTMVGILFAIVISKQLYGGLGSNPFNPAMVGYALLLVSFPVEMTTHWATPSSLTELPDFLSTLQYIFGGGNLNIDGVTMATPLDTYKHQIDVLTREEVSQLPIFGQHVALGWEWVNLGFLAGGLLLIWRKIITWHIPLSMLAALAVCSLVLGWDPDRYTPVSIHLLSGATMLGAFFIATDPVTAATSRLGKLYYGAGIGILIYIIRTWGSYPDAVAFSVLLMNFAAPFLDYYTKPRTYGHRKAHRGIKKSD
ncbi:electron transport complex subunit RsxD [Hahella sp. CCB-MM4]|uniref:electron transport complex subunit RsxD n=1 Tax=Hahella sp. (strain CCB-MM4) TaxID=1926491 RepID=UPI000B9B1667|nr:electron transport complex subunit RsxD [Hahella sp. CCB-MM4]OZG72479.1 electron transport complex subunit RsxD [Hahella sp. CCB-MM4]